MNKINDSHLFMGVCAAIVLGVVVILKLGRHHRGICESAGKDIDNRLNSFGTILDRATQFVKHASRHVPYGDK